MNNLRAIVLTKYDDFFELFALQYLKTVSCRLVVIDDGLSRKIKEKFSGFTYLESPKPFAWCTANNAGMNYCIYDDVLLLQDDWLIQTKGIDLIMQKIAYDDSAIGTVVSLMDNVMVKEMWPENKVEGVEYSKVWVDVPPMFIRRKVLDDVGYFDEGYRFGIGGAEDRDYSRMLREKGYNVAIAQQCFIRHGGPEFGRKHSNTFNRTGGIDWEVNKVYYDNKWAIKRKPKPQPIVTY